jgi:outer membrane protein assembly factor BamB
VITGPGATLTDLIDAHRTRDLGEPTHEHAEAVIACPEGVAVVCTVREDDGRERLRVVWLAGDGAIARDRKYSIELGAGRAAAPTGEGGVMIAGELQRSPTDYAGTLIELDAGGDLVAARTVGPPGATGLRAIAALEDGELVAGGAAAGHAWILRGRRGGELSTAPWHEQRGADADPAARGWLAGADEVSALCSLPEGGLAVATRSGASTTSMGRTTVTALGRDGEPRWHAALPERGRGEPAALVRSGDGAIFAAGHGELSAGDPAQIWIAALAPTGAVRWERTLGRAGEQRRCRAAAALPDGGVAVVGDTLRGTVRRIRVAVLEPDGELRWERELDGSGHDVAAGLALAPGGGLVLAASSIVLHGGSRARVMRLDGDGRSAWDLTLARAPD